MRLTGTLTAWNDERGFGFIRPDDGGPDVFVHIKAFRLNGARPRVAARVAFEIEIGREGKARARMAEIVGANAAFPGARCSTATAVPRHRNAPPLSLAALSAIPAFLLLCVWVQLNWTLPTAAVFGYPLLSIVTFTAYSLDKTAAHQGQWRTTEASLQLLALCGGWPGAIVAQQFLRHKSSKSSFQAQFRVMVAANLVGFLVLCWQREGILLIFRDVVETIASGR